MAMPYPVQAASSGFAAKAHSPDCACAVESSTGPLGEDGEGSVQSAPYNIQTVRPNYSALCLPSPDSDTNVQLLVMDPQCPELKPVVDVQLSGSFLELDTHTHTNSFCRMVGFRTWLSQPTPKNRFGKLSVFQPRGLGSQTHNIDDNVMGAEDLFLGARGFSRVGLSTPGIL